MCRRLLTPTAACGPWRAYAPPLGGHRSSPCACGSRADACGRACSAGKSVSLQSPSCAVDGLSCSAVGTSLRAGPRLTRKSPPRPDWKSRAYRIGPRPSQSERRADRARFCDLRPQFERPTRLGCHPHIDQTAISRKLMDLPGSLWAGACAWLSLALALPAVALLRLQAFTVQSGQPLVPQHRSLGDRR